MAFQSGEEVALCTHTALMTPLVPKDRLFALDAVTNRNQPDCC
jgi:hypothetical protein